MFLGERSEKRRLVAAREMEEREKIPIVKSQPRCLAKENGRQTCSKCSSRKLIRADARWRVFGDAGKMAKV